MTLQDVEDGDSQDGLKHLSMQNALEIDFFSKHMKLQINFFFFYTQH